MPPAMPPCVSIGDFGFGVWIEVVFVGDIDVVGQDLLAGAMLTDASQ